MFSDVFCIRTWGGARAEHGARRGDVDWGRAPNKSAERVTMIWKAARLFSPSCDAHKAHGMLLFLPKTQRVTQILKFWRRGAPRFFSFLVVSDGGRWRRAAPRNFFSFLVLFDSGIWRRVAPIIFLRFQCFLKFWNFSVFWNSEILKFVLVFFFEILKFVLLVVFFEFWRRGAPRNFFVFSVFWWWEMTARSAEIFFRF